MHVRHTERNEIIVNGLTPIERVRAMIDRISRNRFLCPTADEYLFYKICERYSGSPRNTFNAIHRWGCGHYYRGNWNTFDRLGAKHTFKCEEAYDDLIPYTEVFTRTLKEKHIPHSKLVLCASCGTHHGRIYKRHDLYDLFQQEKDSVRTTYEKIIVCTKCWNKYKPFAKSLKRYSETKTLLNKLTKERLKCQKSKQPAT